MSKARNFNGTSQRLTGAVTFLSPSASTWTMMAWIKPNSITGTPQSTIFTLYQDSSDRQCRVRFGYTTATVELDDSQNGTYFTNSGIVIPDTNYHHICYRQGGGDGTYDKFLDGAKTVISTTFSAQVILNLVGTIAHIYVAERSTFGNFFGGAIAELAFWNVKLSDAFIANVANPNGLTTPASAPSGLLGYWPLGLGSPEPDQSSGGVSLTLTGTPGIVAGPYPDPPTDMFIQV